MPSTVAVISPLQHPRHRHLCELLALNMSSAPGRHNMPYLSLSLSTASLPASAVTMRIHLSVARSIHHSMAKPTPLSHLLVPAFLRDNILPCYRVPSDGQLRNGGRRAPAISTQRAAKYAAKDAPRKGRLLRLLEQAAQGGPFPFPFPFPPGSQSPQINNHLGSGRSSRTARGCRPGQH